MFGIFMKQFESGAGYLPSILLSFEWNISSEIKESEAMPINTHAHDRNMLT